MGRSSKILSGYLALTRVLGPVYRGLVARRKRAGKEDPVRFEERFGHASLVRPEGRLIWMHAASVGETQSLLGLIPALLETCEDLSILVTSGTKTSAELMARDLPQRAFHQYSPVDTPKAALRFLAHWKPDVAVWVESEIWPRMLVETKKRGVPMLLLNARVSRKSLDRWSFARRAAEDLFAMFDLVLVQDRATNDLLGSLGLEEDKRVLTGSLKSELAPAMPDTKAAQIELSYLQSKKHWVAASTHKGEDQIVLQAHKELPEDSQLILVPRHPDRGPAVAELALEMGFKTGCRSQGHRLDGGAQVYVADSIGEMGLWYRGASVSFVGGSLIEGIGGHNPFEPILLGSNVVIGPHVGNFQDVYQALLKNEAVRQIVEPEALSGAVLELWQEDQRVSQLESAVEMLSGQPSVTNATRDRIIAML